LEESEPPFELTSKKNDDLPKQSNVTIQNRVNGANRLIVPKITTNLKENVD
jgi:hypothetical protein